MATNDDWLARTVEPTLDPELPICDPHHHLWDFRRGGVAPRYLLGEFLEDSGSGHNIVSTVFVECGTMFKAAGPDELRPLGETEFAAGIAAMSESGQYGSTRIAAGIVGTARLGLGDAVAEVLDRLIAAAGGRFRGIREGAAWHESPDVPNHRTEPRPDMYLDSRFREGFRHLASRGLSFEGWCYHPQIPALTDLARAFPDTTIVLDHFGGPLGVGPFAGRKDEVFAEWRRSIGPLAECPNVVAKLGGIAMEVNGYGWHEREAPPTSEELMEANPALLRAHHRTLRCRALHVRVELPGREGELQLQRAVERVQAADRELLVHRARPALPRHRGAGVSNRTVRVLRLHLRVPNHGRLFDALTTAHVPDWK